MFFILSKLLYVVILPLTWVLGLLLLGLLSRQPRWKKFGFRWGSICLLIFTNPLLANWSMSLWEKDPIAYSQINKNYDYIVVLSGITNPTQEPKDRIHFNKGADRIVHGIELYKKGVGQKLLITGGNASILRDDASEGEQLLSFAIMSGVPQEDLILENKARNTYENALYTNKIIENDSEVLVVTSAFHARRAMGCFHKLGVKADIFPTDLYARPYSWTPDEWLIPQLGALQFWNILIKEWVGITAYKMKGYL